MKFIDLFSGIGGFRSALEMNGHECLAFAEIDKYARQSYKAIYNTENEQEWHDVTRITDDDFRYFKGKADIIVGGFPCQAFSIAGKRKGFEDTRGTLFFEIARAIKEIQPSYVLLENVKGLFSHDGGRTFGTIIQTLDELGFITEWGLFNSKYWGVPQNRERVYILATRKDKFKEPLLFDLVKQQTEVTTRLIDVLENDVDEKYYLSEEKTKKLTLNDDLSGKLNHFNYDVMDRIYSTEKLSPTLNTMQGGNRQPKIAVKGFKEIVKVRKYEVNKLALSELLRISKQDTKISNKEISNKLNVPITKVEHWFRSDKSFSIPDANIWFELKKLLNITNTEHDEAITTFINKESNFDTTNRIYDTDYLSPTLNTTSEPKIAIPISAPDRINKKQNGKRFKEDGEPMFTLTAQDRHGIAIREANKKGYTIAEEGDSVNVLYVTSKTRRGRVGKQIAQTLQTGDVNQGVVIGGDFNVEKIERDTFEILQTLQKEIGEKEITEWRSRILDTFQQEEILRQDVYEKRLDTEQDEKKLERKEQSCECEIENKTFDKQEKMREMSIDKEFRCSSHGRGSIQQFARELTSIMQKLSHETSQEKNLYHLRETTQGFRLLRETLSEIQKIWRSALYKNQGIRIRKLVPIETWRLQGFTDEQFYKAKDSGVSNSQLYKQAGNSVTVNVVDVIVKQLKED